MANFILGQRVIYKDMISRNTKHPDIVDVICTVCIPETGGDNSKTWINNPARNYKHWVSDTSIKPLPNGQL